MPFQIQLAANIKTTGSPLPPAPPSELQKEAWLRSIEHANTQINERAGYREKRLYWLYSGSFAICIALMQAAAQGKGMNAQLLFAGMLAIQCLCIGIAWNYYSNNIKIKKLWLQNENTYRALGIKPPLIDTHRMTLYAFIYHVLETFAFNIPSAGALFVTLHCKDYAPDITGMNPCCALAISLTSCLLFGVLAAGSVLLAFWGERFFGRTPVQE